MSFVFGYVVGCVLTVMFLAFAYCCKNDNEE